MSGRQLRIAIDYNAAVRQGAGIGRYTREIVRAAIAHAPQHHYALFYAARGLPADSPQLAALRELCAVHPNVEARPLPIGERLLTILWQRLRVPLPVERLIGSFDVLHAPDFVLPPTSAPSILTVHDLTFMVHPETAVPELRRYLERAVPRSLRRASLVLADSLSTKEDLRRLLGVDESRITVIEPGVGAQFRPISDRALLEAARARLGLPQRFILNMGTVEPRKNLERLIEAFAMLGPEHADVALVIGGRRGWMADPIYAAVERLGLKERVRFLDFVADEDLPLLYNLADVFAYPSLYEGFGIPPAEALACGAPVLTSRVSSMPEAVGDAALLLDPTDTAAIAEGLARLLTDASLRAELRRRGLRHVSHLTWQRAGQILAQCYELAASPLPRAGEG